MSTLYSVTGRTLYQSNSAKTFGDALEEAIKLRIELPGLNLDNRDLSGRTLAGLRAPTASCVNTNFSKCNLENAYMPGSSFRGADFSRAQAPEANLLGSDLSGATLIETNLTGSDLDRVRGKLVKATLVNLDFASVRHADLPAITLDRASMISTDWTGSKLLGASFASVTATHSKLDEVEGSRAKFVNADLRWSSISGQFTSANFSDANLHHVTLNGDIDLAGAIFDRAQGVGSELSADGVLQQLLQRSGTSAPMEASKPTRLPHPTR